MERASKGEDVTEELKAIESILAEKKEEKEEQIRKIQAQEYAKAMSSSEGTKKTNTELSAINENTKTMAGVLNEGFSKVTSAIEASPKVESAAQQTALKREETQKTLQAAKAVGEPYAISPDGKTSAEAKASYIYTGAYGGDITKTPAEEHQWGVPVGQEAAYAFVEKTPTIAKTDIPVVEKAAMVAEEPGILSFGEKTKPYMGGVFGQADDLLASDEQIKKSQMAASLPTPFGEPFVKKPDLGYADRLKEAGKTDEEIKKEEMIKSAARGGLTMTFPEEGESVEEFAERTKSPEQKREEAARRDVASKYKSDRPVDSYDVLKKEVDVAKTEKDRKKDLSVLGAAEAKREVLFDEGSVAVEEKEKAAGLKEESKEAKSLKEKSLKETDQGKESKKVQEKLNTEISDLKDEVEKLKTTIVDVNDVFKDLSDSADNVIALGDASKDSASLINGFGDSVSAASSSLDILSSKMSTATTTNEESGPTMTAEGTDFDFISEEDAINLVNFTKEELLENINNIDHTELLDSLVGKTDVISKDVASIKENVTIISDVVSEEDFNTFKEKALRYFEEVDRIKDIGLNDLASSADFDDLKSVVADYVETIDELKTLVDDLVDTSSSHSTSIVELEAAFNLVGDELRNHDEQFTKLEESLGSMDHKFTIDIDDLKSSVGEAMDLARAAYTFATT
jgi:hypothetical protein